MKIIGKIGIFGIGVIVGAYGFLYFSDLGAELKKQEFDICEPEYLDIKDFANIAGRSIYCIYGSMSNKLKPYVQNINGRKRIHREALKLFM